MEDITIYRAALRRAPVLAKLDESDFDLLLGGLTPTHLSPGQVLFMAGDTGDSMVVVARGELRVTLPGPGGGERLAKLTAGEAVGEMACIDPGPRSATVTAATEATVMMLSRALLDSLRSIAPEILTKIVGGVIDEVTHRLRETNARIATLAGMSGLPASNASLRADRGQGVDGPVNLEGIPLLEGLDGGELALLQRVAHAHMWASGAHLCVEGGSGSSCFLITDGEVEILRSMGETSRVLATLPRGAWVGQMSMVDSAPRSATVRAKGNVTALVLSREAYQGLISDASPLALRLQEKVAQAGIRQLRMANSRLADALGSPVETTAASADQISFMGAAVGEWALTLEAMEATGDFDVVEVLSATGSFA